MKLCGHTMGTPDKGIFEAIEFFARLGYEGIEIRCAADGHLDPEITDLFRVEMIAEAAHRAGLRIVCLTPYYKDFVTPEAAEASLEGLHKTFKLAQDLECRLVRVIGGVWPQTRWDKEYVWERTALGLQQAADIAIQYGVRLVLENHAGTLTQTAADTVAMIQAIERPNVGILLDYFWLVAAGQEDPLEAVRLQAPYVLHCHCKGLKRLPDGAVQATFLDEGEIDWLPVLQILKEYGYQGYLSDEYEKFWRPELPPPEEGMARNAAYLRACLARLNER